jgi:hypothetical protein
MATFDLSEEMKKYGYTSKGDGFTRTNINKSRKELLSTVSFSTKLSEVDWTQSISILVIGENREFCISCNKSGLDEAKSLPLDRDDLLTVIHENLKCPDCNDELLGKAILVYFAKTQTWAALGQIANDFIFFVGRSCQGGAVSFGYGGQHADLSPDNGSVVDALERHQQSIENVGVTFSHRVGALHRKSTLRLSIEDGRLYKRIMENCTQQIDPNLN